MPSDCYGVNCLAVVIAAFLECALGKYDAVYPCLFKDAGKLLFEFYEELAAFCNVSFQFDVVGEELLHSNRIK